MNKTKLKFEEAVKLAVKENMERDRRLGLLEDETEDDKKIYEEEAIYLLKETCENYLPEFKDHHHIFVY